MAALNLTQMKASITMRSTHFGRLSGLVVDVFRKLGFEDAGSKETYINKGSGHFQFTRCKITEKFSALDMDVWIR